MTKVTELFDNVKQAKGRNEKKNLLLKYETEPYFKEILHFMYNPYIKTGIKMAKLLKGMHIKGIKSDKEPDKPVAWHDVIEYFTTHDRGNAHDVEMSWYFINSAKSDAERDLLVAIITKNLKIGVSATTLNEVYGKAFIPKVGVMLAHPYKEKKSSVTGKLIVTEKLDGVRRILLKNNGVVSMYSRSGQPDEGLVDILEDAKQLPDGYVFDGELLAEGTFSDCIAQRQATNAIANSKGTRRGLTFNVFDMIPYEDFVLDRCMCTALTRKAGLAALFGDAKSYNILTQVNDWTLEAFKDEMVDTSKVKHIVPVPVLGVVDNDEKAINELAAPIWRRGGEGVMLNTSQGLYRIKRSKDILKVKHVESYDLPIVDFEEGTGKFAGTLGAIVVEYQGQRVGVGSGFDDATRAAIWKDKEKYLGLTVEIDSFGPSTNKNGGVSLNCPIFKGIRYDK